ncbi:MAG: LPS assembly protein LptD, partial [Gallionella sp.]
MRPAIADDAPPAAENVKSPPLANEQTQDIPAVVEADQLEGKKGKQIEATGNAVLRKGDQTIHADRLLYFQDSQDIHAQGSVMLIKGDQSIRADRLWYFRDNGDVDAQGSVLLRQKDSSMSGPHLRLNMDTSAGVMEKPAFVLGENNARGAADAMQIQDKHHFTFDQASYTTCPADRQDWSLRMGGLEIDKSRQIGIAHHAWVEFMNVPILYSPWMDFPLNEQRKSGFLAPIFGGTANGGSELTLPYYWNIAANLDATISPRFMAKRGLMVSNEIRYLEQNYQGELELDALPHDRLADSRRSFVSLKHNMTLNPRLYGDVTYNRVSDDAYFRDLANAVNATSQVNFLREGQLTYDADWGHATARVQRFQTLQDPVSPIISPYKRLPQLTVSTQKSYRRAKFSFAGEFVDFAHPTLPNGRRLVVKPGVSYALLNDPGFYVTPMLSLHSTQYVMGANNSASFRNTSRTLPILSVDSGVKFEREWNFFGNDYVQSLEPRAFYVYIPYKNQDALPNYDSALSDFNFTQMFSENRFAGSDRIGDANQLTLAMSSRLLEQSNGRERLKVMLGERFSLNAP